MRLHKDVCTVHRHKAEAVRRKENMYNRNEWRIYTAHISGKSMHIYDFTVWTEAHSHDQVSHPYCISMHGSWPKGRQFSLVRQIQSDFYDKNMFSSFLSCFLLSYILFRGISASYPNCTICETRTRITSNKLQRTGINRKIVHVISINFPGEFEYCDCEYTIYKNRQKLREQKI